VTHLRCGGKYYKTHSIRYDSMYLTFSKKLMGSQLSLPQGSCCKFIAEFNSERIFKNWLALVKVMPKTRLACFFDSVYVCSCAALF